MCGGHTCPSEQEGCVAPCGGRGTEEAFAGLGFSQPKWRPQRVGQCVPLCFDRCMRAPATFRPCSGVGQQAGGTDHPHPRPLAGQCEVEHWACAECPSCAAALAKEPDAQACLSLERLPHVLLCLSFLSHLVGGSDSRSGRSQGARRRFWRALEHKCPFQSRYDQNSRHWLDFCDVTDSWKPLAALM